MLAIVCWKWKPKRGYRSTFGPKSVNVLRSMVERNYQKPHRFICVTDDPTGIDKEVEVIPLWDDLANMPSLYGVGQPSCYRRLKAFSVEAQQLFGPRFVSLDLDTVVVGDLSPLWDRNEEFIIWNGTSPATPYNGSMFLMTAGSRRQVWENFDPVNSPLAGKRLGYFGSDQAWIGACLGPNEERWTHADGVYSYRSDIRKLNPNQLPENARLIFLNGQWDPWMPEIINRHQWVRQHYR